ncbi:unnamed protein product, partial [Cylicostephanus goldi]
TKKGPLDAFVTRRGGTHDPVARLSLLGAGLEPVADDDPYDGESSSLITEKSRRFDRPLLRRKYNKNEHPTTAAKNEAVNEEKPPADSCDLLGSIIPEQVKTLAPGRLFAIGGGRFNTTDDFEKYKERKTNLLSSELKAKLGIPVDKDDAIEAKTEVGKSRDKGKERNPSFKSEEQRKVTASSPRETSSGMPHRAGDTTSRETRTVTEKATVEVEMRGEGITVDLEIIEAVGRTEPTPKDIVRREVGETALEMRPEPEVDHGRGLKMGEVVSSLAE